MAEVSVLMSQGDEFCMDLPPGFRFHPTDEEIITNYLSEKAVNNSFSARAMGEVDLNKSEPWDLPSKAKMGEKEWYFFVHKDRKYPTGTRTNRATEAGYWKATGKDKEIYKGRGLLVGMKKTLVFYRGRAPKGEKTNWVMHEYRLEGKSSHYNIPKAAKEEWVVSRVFHKNIGVKKSPILGLVRINSKGDDLLDSPTLPPLLDLPFNSNRPSSSFVNDDDGFDFRGINPAITTSMPSYFSTMVGMEDPQNYYNTNHQLVSCNLQPQNPNFYPQIPTSNPYFSLPGSANLGYLHQEEAMLSALAAANTDVPSASRRHCKVEQHSNQSMVSVSQDAGLSNDRNTEISSVDISKHDIGSCRSFDDPDNPSSVRPVLDLENMWKY